MVGRAPVDFYHWRENIMLRIKEKAAGLLCAGIGKCEISPSKGPGSGLSSWEDINLLSLERNFIFLCLSEDG